MLGEKLRAARKSLGLSLRDLQAKLGNVVTAQAIGKYERGEMRPGPEILEQLAGALGVPKEYFLLPSAVQLGEVEFRENFLRSKKDEEQVKATVLNRVSRYLQVEELLHVATVEWDEPKGCPFPGSDVRDAEAASYKVREDWKLGTDRIPSLAEFLEDRGIKVLLIQLPESIAGMTCFIQRKNLKKVPVIVINSETTGERQRFTLAHELGHLVLELKKDGLNAENICHRFSSSFLMPDRVLWATLGKHRQSISLGELVSLKQLFGVSIQAIVYRCKDLEIISQATYRALYSEFSRQGWLKPPYAEPLRLPKEETQRFRRLCFRAIAEGALSKEKAAALLGLSENEISSLLNASGF